MISLAETGLMNALLAVSLALPVLILGRIYHRPALIHAFWILVLLKLLAPPLYQIPIDLDVAAQLANSADGQSATSNPVGFPFDYRDWLLRLSSLLGWIQGLAIPCLIVWVTGSICWFGWQGWRLVRFTQVFLKSARLGPPSLQKKAQVLAQQMGLKHCPAVWLLPAVVSPMLWSGGGRPRILFPRELLGRLDHQAVATLLTHELAHYKRGDHLVRLLEFVASGLFWWLPIVWVARRELEISEEKCCDAWVVSQFPANQRQYADALLATVDFLAQDQKHPPRPAIACGLGEVPLLRQRLMLIMRGTTPKSLSTFGRVVVVVAALLMPVAPSFKTVTNDPSESTTQTRSAKQKQLGTTDTDLNSTRDPSLDESPASPATETYSVTEQDWEQWQKIYHAMRLRAGLSPLRNAAFIQLTANDHIVLRAEWNGVNITWSIGQGPVIVIAQANLPKEFIPYPKL